MKKGKQVVKALHKIAEKNLVDVVGGTGDMQEWLSDIQYRNKPDVCVLILEQIDDGRYRGAIYITETDFHKRGVI